jgi:hypothetical protein
MNRIILIGNGFDLAHGLETSYSHFIDDFWGKRIALIKEVLSKKGIFADEFITVRNKSNTLIPFNTATYSDLKKLKDGLIIDITFKNKFFEKITEKRYQNWVDIENFYFHELMRIVNDYEFIKRSKREHELNIQQVVQLNKELQDIKVELEKYLLSIIHVDRFQITRDNLITQHIFSTMHLTDFTSAGCDSIIDEQAHVYKSEIEEHNETIANNPEARRNFLLNRFCLEHQDGTYKFNDEKWETFTKKKDQFHKYIECKPSNYLFLNFNYTSTETEYTNLRDSSFVELVPSIIHIHGELNKPNNPIIFGYGDEISKDYLRLEEFSENELLNNVKSIEYLNTDNYRRLIEYIDSDFYQIFVMGHSCGNSDRTLLNTLFEHENCASIKVYYHQETPTKDNYSDIVRNISRNFKDKKVMRERVVNKKQCEPLRKH